MLQLFWDTGYSTWTGARKTHHSKEYALLLHEKSLDYSNRTIDPQLVPQIREFNLDSHHD